MNNLLPQSIRMHEKFDLKGSTYKRFASKAERSKANPTLKDLDFNELYKTGIILDAQTYDLLTDIIKRDCLVGGLENYLLKAVRSGAGKLQDHGLQLADGRP